MTRDDWIAFTCAIARPEREDDERCPEGVELVPQWERRRLIAEWLNVPVEDVVSTESREPIGLPEVLGGQHYGPAPTDWCAYSAYNGTRPWADDRFYCNGMCNGTRGG